MAQHDISDDDVKKIISQHSRNRVLRMGMFFPGTAGEAKARSDGQAEVGQMIAGLINELNSFVEGGPAPDPAGRSLPKKVSGKMGIEEMIDYLRIRIKDMVFDLEATHRELQTYIDNDEFNC